MKIIFKMNFLDWIHLIQFKHNTAMQLLTSQEGLCIMRCVIVHFRYGIWSPRTLHRILSWYCIRTLMYESVPYYCNQQHEILGCCALWIWRQILSQELSTRWRNRGNERFNRFLQHFISRIIDECRLAWNEFEKIIYSFWIHLSSFCQYSAQIRRLREIAVVRKFCC